MDDRLLARAADPSFDRTSLWDTPIDQQGSASGRDLDGHLKYGEIALVRLISLPRQAFVFGLANRI